MAFVSEQTADMLEDSGDFQRAYTVVRIHEEAYDAFAAKHAQRYQDEFLLHIDASEFANVVLAVVFPDASTK